MIPRWFLDPVVSGGYVTWLLDKYSVKHEYEGKWDGKNRLTTCDPHAKHTVVNSNSPQEVEEKKEIIFTYDVDFQVLSFFEL